MDKNNREPKEGDRVVLKDDTGFHLCGIITGRRGVRGKWRGSYFAKFPGPRRPQLYELDGRPSTVPIPEDWLGWVEGNNGERWTEWIAARPIKGVTCG